MAIFAIEGRGEEVSFQSWLLFVSLVGILLYLDLAVFHRKAHRVSSLEAVWWTVFWVALALGFNIWIYFRFGEERATYFLIGYLIEEALSVDNIFVFVVIFQYFQVKPEYQHRILFWGILGAIIMRLLFIFAGTALINRFHWTIYIFGIILIWSGWKLIAHKEAKVDPEKNLVLKLFRRFVPTVQEFEGVKFIVKRNGRRYATPLLLVLVVVETTDVMFAIDSVPAIIGITTDRFIIFTSNIFAILGLRSIYFLLANMMEAFRFLKVGLSLILIFVGLKMILSDVVKVHYAAALGVVVAILITSVIASLALPRIGGREESPVRPPGSPPADEEA